MTAPVPDGPGLPPFSDYAAKLARAAERPSVEVGPRVAPELVVELLAALGYPQPARVESVHFEAGRVLVTQTCPTCSNGSTRETFGMVCPRCGTDYARPGSWVGFVTVEHVVDQP